MRRLTILVPTALFLATACATSYQSEAFTGGYSEMQLSKNAWLVNFRGNGYTRPARVSDFALLRACELILEAGCTHYRLLDAQTVSTYGGAIVSTHAHGATAVPIKKPEAQIAIECADASEGLDASETAARLRAKYSIRQ